MHQAASTEDVDEVEDFLVRHGDALELMALFGLKGSEDLESFLQDRAMDDMGFSRDNFPELYNGRG